MKREPLFLVAFLMCLYITPSLFMTSYPDIAALQNTPKEFVVADSWVETGNVSVGFDLPEWNEAGTVSVEFDTFPYGSNPSNQSIEGFSETLSDNVLYYPDMYVQEATYGNVSGTETNDYTYMLSDDASYWNNTDGTDVYSYIDVEGPILAESVNVTINALASGIVDPHTVYLYLVNPSGSDLLICQDTGVGAGDAEIDGTYTILNWMDYYDL